jgi:hypothetical protein
VRLFLRTKARARRCPFCHDALGPGPRVTCPACGATYHADCVKACATLGCQGVLRAAPTRVPGARKNLLLTALGFAFASLYCFAATGGYWQAAILPMFFLAPILLAAIFIRPDPPGAYRVRGIRRSQWPAEPERRDERVPRAPRSREPERER